MSTNRNQILINALKTRIHQLDSYIKSCTAVESQGFLNELEVIQGEIVNLQREVVATGTADGNQGMGPAEKAVCREFEYASFKRKDYASPSKEQTEPLGDAPNPVLLAFGAAITAALNGHRVQRQDWNPGCWITAGEGFKDCPASKFWNRHSKAEAINQGGKADVAPYLIACDPDGVIHMGYQPDAADIFAEDWVVLADEAVPEEVEQFKPGQRVQHLSGGPEMIVIGTSGDRVSVRWYDNSLPGFLEWSFNKIELKHISP